jgi:hypothetical protein
MILKPRETLNELKEDRNTLLRLMSSPYADQIIFLSCNDKLKVIDEKIEKLLNEKHNL